MTLKKVFILETEGFPERIERNLRTYGEEGSLKFKFSLSKTNFRRHLPEGHDLYLLHISNTEEEAIEELRERQPWSKIFIRDSMKQKLNPSVKSLIDGRYNIDTHEYCERVLKSIDVRVRTWKEIYGDEVKK